MSTHRLRLTLSEEVLNVKLLVIEGVNCITAIKPTGSGWVCELSALNVNADQDVDIFAFVEGLPKTGCEMTVQVDDQDAKEFDTQFNTKGNTFFNEAVKVKGAK